MAQNRLTSVLAQNSVWQTRHKVSHPGTHMVTLSLALMRGVDLTGTSAEMNEFEVNAAVKLKGPKQSVLTVTQPRGTRRH